MKKKALQILIFSILLYALPCQAQDAITANGLSWLASTQNTDGSWGAQTDLAFVYSAEAVNALKSSGTGSINYTGGVNWLVLQDAISADELSRKIYSLVNSGIDSSALISTLLSYKNPDGGWSYKNNPVSDSLDTSLALQALKAANYSDTTVLYQAINFLTTTQNPDGGWGSTTDDASNTYATALVLKTLASYSSQFSVQSSIDKASTSLLTKQNPDGGFDSSPSNVYETALSIISLIESGQSSALPLQNGINYLTTTQSSNGSWNDDPYSTALALQALAKVKPNLVAGNIALSKSMPQENELITITTTIKNVGFEDASNVVVRFYLGDPLSGGVQIGTDQIIPSLRINASTPVSTSTLFIGTGGKTIFVIADPDNLISETSKIDNKTSVRLWIATAPDLAVFSEDLKPSTYVPTTGTPFTLNYTVRNLGESSTNGFDVALYDGQPSGTPLQTAHLSGLNGIEVRTGTIGVTLSGNGPHTLYLVADPGNAIAEISKTNNTGSVTVTVGGVQTAADLAVTPMDITLNPTRPTANQIVQIAARVRNQGTEPANDFVVEIYDNAPEAGGTLIFTKTVSTAGGAEETITTNWTSSTGIHDVYVVLDRMNRIVESDESNNRASIRVMADMVDITLSATDLVFTPAHPVINDMVALTITAHNTGIKDTNAFSLALYDGDPNAGGTLLQTYPISNIAGDSSATVTYTFTAVPKTYRFYVVADPDNKVTELSKDNNLAIRSLKIKAPGEILGPDLVPIKIDLTDTTTDPQTLAISGTAHVTIQNKGDDKITTPFDVIIFEDKDGDGKYTAGVDSLLGTGTNSMTLWPEGANIVDVSLIGIVKFLHSPLYAMVDSGDAIREQNEDNNILVSCKDCQVVPANPIQPVVKWKYIGPTDYPYQWGEGIRSNPIVVNLIDTNEDGRVDGKDIPVILFVTYEVIDQYHRGLGKIHAVRGDNGQELFTIFDPAHSIGNNPFLAVADIDNDGHPEIIVPGYSCTAGGGCFLIFDHMGKFKWDNAELVNEYITQQHKNLWIGASNAPSIADIDSDGKAEIIVGPFVFNNDGSVKWAGYAYEAPYGSGIGQWPGASIVADLDLDGKQEIIAGNTAYNPDGTIKWWNKSLTDGFVAIANFNDEPYPEIVLVDARGKVYLLDHNGNIKWGPVTPETSSILAVPTVADFDGDGEMEIGLRGIAAYSIIDKNGYIKKSIPIPLNYQQDGRQMAGTVFDLKGDGKSEVMINGTGYFRIFDGVSGSLLYEDQFGAAGGSLQNIIVSDVDGDGHAEIVVTGYNYTTKYEELHVYGSVNNDWVGARTIWNQANYHVTNVNDDGSIPKNEAPSWLLNNTYRTQAAIGPITNPYLTPNLTASLLRAAQNADGVYLTVRVGNGGAKDAASGVNVTFYDGDPVANVVIGTASTTKILQPGEYQDITYSTSTFSLGLHHIYAVVNKDNSISECRIDDNQTTIDITLATGLPDLAISTEDIVLPAAPYYEGSNIPVTAVVKNQGPVPASNVTARLYLGSPTNGGVQLGTTQVISSLAANASAMLTFNFDTLGHAGTNVLYIVLDQESAVIESNKTNNIAAITITIQMPQLPNLAIDENSIQLSAISPREGEKVTITATVTNRGTAVGNVPVKMAVMRDDGGGMREIYTETKTIYPVISFGQSATVQTVLDTTGLAGQQNVVVTIDPANTIIESSKTDNTASKSLFIQSAGLASSIALDKPVYRANETVNAVITVSNTLPTARVLTADCYVKDSAGNLIATIAQADAINIGPNSSVSIPKTWNIGKTLAGNYFFTAEVAENAENGKVVSRASVGFSITADKSIDSKVTTDKIAYNPNETVILTSVVTSRSGNYVFENLSAKLTIGLNSLNGSNGSFFVETKNISTLMPAATFTFKTYWNTGTYSAGTYPVTLEVKDETGTVIATGTQNLVISNAVKPSALLKGQVSMDKQSILIGDPVNVTYSVTNTGNIDLASVNLTIQTVHVVTQAVYDTLSSQATLTMGTSYSNTGTINTTAYTAKDYLVVLRANIAGIEETLAGTYFRVEGAPSAPSLASPANGSDVATFTPALMVNNASDPNDDKLTYEFEAAFDPGFALIAASTKGAVSGQQGTTSWQVSTPLTENQTYYWRARAYDNKLYGDWMAVTSFRVNTINDPPTAPIPTSPVDGSSVSILTPIMVVNNATDPDTSSLTYNFDVALDPDFVQIVASTKGAVSGQQGTTSWQVSTPLTENTTYYWRAQADDWFITGPWSATARFFVNTSNDAPTAPVITAPANNAVVPALEADVTITNSTDLDSPVISYFLEADTVMTFDSANIIRSGSVAEGQNTTLWHVTGLQDNTQYYVRAKASDGQADSPWATIISFFANTVNDPPTAPTLANPSNGAGVNAFTPTLSVHNSTDPDRDVLTYEFEIYSDSGLTLKVGSGMLDEGGNGVTAWTIPVSLTENQTYYWRTRAFDGSLYSPWMSTASFMVNTANDAPGAPKLSSPANGSSVATLTPALAITNATDPDSDRLTYDFDVAFDPGFAQIAASTKDAVSGQQGTTSWQDSVPLTENQTYYWRARAFDGDRYGPWMDTASFSVHISQTSINATINFDPDTLNKKSNGNWVVVYLELPAGYLPKDIDVASIRLEGTIPAEPRPFAVGDYDKDGIPDLMVKFNRSDVINLLPNGDHVLVHVTGKVGTSTSLGAASTTFEGVDVIRVMK